MFVPASTQAREHFLVISHSCKVLVNQSSPVQRARLMQTHKQCVCGGAIVNTLAAFALQHAAQTHKSLSAHYQAHGMAIFYPKPRGL